MLTKETVAQLKSLARNTFIYNSGEILTKAIAFLLIPLYTRLLSPDDYGVISVVTTIIAVLIIIYRMGQETATTRLYFEYKNEGERKEYFGAIILFIIGFTLAISIILTEGGFGLSSILFPTIPFDPYIKIAIWTTFFQTLMPLVLVLYRVREQALKYIKFSILVFLTEIALIIYFVVFLKQGALGKVKGSMIAYCAVYIVSLLVLLNYSTLKFSFTKIWASLKFGLPLLPHTLAHWVLKLSDRVILQKYSTLNEVGLYTLGYNLGLILFLFTSSFNNAWSPFFFKNAETMPKKVFAKIGNIYCFVIILIGLALSIFSKEILVLLSTPRFYRAHTVIPVVVAGYIVHGFYLMAVNQLFFLKKTKFLPLATFVSAAVNIALNILFIPRFGMMAAAVNTFISYLILFVLVFIYSQKYFTVDYEYGKLSFMIFFSVSLYLFSVTSAALFKDAFAIGILKLLILSTFILSGYLLFKKDIGLLLELYSQGRSES